MTDAERDQLMGEAVRGNADAAYELGVYFGNKELPTSDASRAVQYYAQAAQAGHILAMNNLAVRLLSGDGVGQDQPAAFVWIQRSAQGGNPQAMFNLGIVYENGMGTPADLVSARAWYQEALRAGHTDAEAALARLQPPAAMDTHAGQPADPEPAPASPPMQAPREPAAPPPPAPPPQAAPRRKWVVPVLILLVIAGAVAAPPLKRAAERLQWKSTTKKAEALAAQGAYAQAAALVEPWKFRANHLQREAGNAFAVLESIRRKWVVQMLEKKEYAAAGRLLEELNEKSRAVAAYEAAGQFSDVERILLKEGRPQEIANLYAAREKWEDAARLYGVARLPEQQAAMLRKLGRSTEAVRVLRQAGLAVPAEELEKAELWGDAAAAYEKSRDLAAAARLFQKAGDLRGAARVLEALGRFADAARACETLARTDRDIGVRLEAARLFDRAGLAPQAAAQRADALAIAKSYGSFKEILSISQAMGQLARGIEYVLAEGDALARKEELFEAEDAYLAANPYFDNSPFDVQTHNRLVGQLNDAVQKLRARMAAYPKLESIDGTNHYLDQRFTHTSIDGLLVNTTGKTIREVTIRIKLFKKNLVGMGQAGASALDAQALAAFAASDAGHVQLIVLRDIAPGASKKFSERLTNRVPYESFNYPMKGLVLAP